MRRAITVPVVVENCSARRANAERPRAGPYPVASNHPAHKGTIASWLGSSCKSCKPSRSAWDMATLGRNQGKRSWPFLAHKIYQLDFSRNIKEFRMVENFLPKETFAKKAARKKRPAVEDAEPANEGHGPSGSWPKEVGVNRVAWDSGGGLNCAPLLASATASGLCRIDWLLGRFYRSRIPHGSIEALRGEDLSAEIDDDDVDED